MPRFLIGLALALAACSGVGGCTSMMPPPHINSMYTGTGSPSPRPDSSLVEVYLDTAPPKRQFAVIGRVEIATENDSRTLENMLSYARAEARRLGGEALINIKTSTTSAAGSGGRSYPVRNVVTGEVIGVNTVGDGPTNRRML